MHEIIVVSNEITAEAVAQKTPLPVIVRLVGPTSGRDVHRVATRNLFLPQLLHAFSLAKQGEQVQVLRLRGRRTPYK